MLRLFCLDKKKKQAMTKIIFMALALATSPANIVAQSISASPQFGSAIPAVDDWSKKIAQKIIAQQEYPRSAQVRGAEGLVKVRVQVAANGTVTGMDLLQSSAFDVLNREATKTIERAAPFPAPPGGARTIIVPLVWKLN